MSSIQEYFSFTGAVLCGIPKVEMKGSEDDWVKLNTKLAELRIYLESIQDILGQRKWWSKVGTVIEKLLETYRDNPDQACWSKILSQTGQNFIFGYF